MTIVMMQYLIHILQRAYSESGLFPEEPAVEQKLPQFRFNLTVGVVEHTLQFLVSERGLGQYERTQFQRSHLQQLLALTIRGVESSCPCVRCGRSMRKPEIIPYNQRRERERRL